MRCPDLLEEPLGAHVGERTRFEWSNDPSCALVGPASLGMWTAWTLPVQRDAYVVRWLIIDSPLSRWALRFQHDFIQGQG